MKLLESLPQLAVWGPGRPEGKCARLCCGAAGELRGIPIACRDKSLNKSRDDYNQAAGKIKIGLVTRSILCARTWLQAERTLQDVLVSIVATVSQTPAALFNSQRFIQTRGQFCVPSAEAALAGCTRDCEASIKIKYGCPTSRALALERLYHKIESAVGQTNRCHVFVPECRR